MPLSDSPALVPRALNVQPGDLSQDSKGSAVTKTYAVGPPTAGSPLAATLPVVARAAAFPPLPADSPLAQLVSDLRALFNRVKASSGERMDRFQSPESFAELDAGVRELINAYITAGYDDWRGMTSFNPYHYVRHLVDACEDFELLVLCWKPGQESRCHNHQDSHGWVTVLDGTVEERRYLAGEPGDAPLPLSASPPKRGGPGTVAAAAPCPQLKHIGTARARRGDGSLHIHDGIGLHVVGCPDECPDPGLCTLHLYSPPITRATLYDPEENKVVTRVPGYFTIRGHKA